MVNQIVLVGLHKICQNTINCCGFGSASPSLVPSESRITHNEVLILNRSLPQGQRPTKSEVKEGRDPRSLPSMVHRARYGDITRSLTHSLLSDRVSLSLSHTHASVKFLSKTNSLFPFHLLEGILSFLTLTDVRREWTHLINGVCMSATFPSAPSKMSSAKGYLQRFEMDLISEVIKNKKFNLGYPQAPHFEFIQHLEIAAIASRRTKCAITL